MLRHTCVRDYKKNAIVGTVVLILALLLCKAVTPLVAGSMPNAQAETAKTLIEDCNLSFAASLQDANPHHQLQNLSVATAYLSAARRMTSDMQLERMTGIDIHRLYTSLESSKREARKAIEQNCPNLASRAPRVQLPQKTLLA